MKKIFSILLIVALLAAVCLYCGCSAKGDPVSDVQSGSGNGSEQGSGDVVPEETLESNPDSSWAVGRFPVPTPD